VVIGRRFLQPNVEGLGPMINPAYGWKICRSKPSKQFRHNIKWLSTAEHVPTLAVKRDGSKQALGARPEWPRTELGHDPV